MICHGSSGKLNPYGRAESSATVTSSMAPKALVKHLARETRGDLSAQTLPGPLDTLTNHLFMPYHSYLKGAVMQTDLVSCSGTQEQWPQRSSQNPSPDEVVPWRRLVPSSLQPELGL